MNPAKKAEAPKPAAVPFVASCTLEIEQRPTDQGPEWRATAVARYRSGRTVEKTTGWRNYARFLVELPEVVTAQRDFIFDGQRPPRNVG